MKPRPRPFLEVLKERRTQALVPNPLNSAVIRARQEILAEKFLELSEVRSKRLTKNGKLTDPWLPTKEWMHQAQQEWRTPRRAGVLSRREEVERHIFSPYWPNEKARNSDFVPRALDTHTPKVMQLVDAMVDEYLLCHYWEAQVSKHQLRPQLYHAISSVQAQIADHYSLLLGEQGFTPEQTIKIVGSAIEGFARTILQISKKPAVAIQPAPPDKQISAVKMLGRIRALSDKEAARMLP